MSGNCSENSAFSYIAISAPHFFLSRTQNILGIKMFFLRLIKGIFNVIKHNKKGLEVVLIDKHILIDMIHDRCRQCV